MKVDNIEKCQMLLSKRATLQKAASILDELQRHALVTISGLAKNAPCVEFLDEDVNLAIQEGIDARIQEIEKQIETL